MVELRGDIGYREGTIAGKEQKRSITSELEKRERDAWKNVLGVDVEVPPLPDSVTPEVINNLKRMDFDLRYVPALNIGNAAYLREKGVDEYLHELEQRYPRWKNSEYLSDIEVKDHLVPRNLNKWFWEEVRRGDIDFPILPGQWMAVETLEKPAKGTKYSKTPWTEKLGFKDDRFHVSWDNAHNAIEKQKKSILSKVGLKGRADIRFLEAIEWNLIGNREGWGKTNTLEWTNTEYRGSGYRSSGDQEPYRLTIGDSSIRGASHVEFGRPIGADYNTGFRVAVVLGS